MALRIPQNIRLQVYDSWTRKKQPLLVGDSESLKIYFCGPTVYQRIHVGNARTFVTFLMFARYMRHIGVDVTLVSNITDINDKIYKAATEQGISSSDLAVQATKWYMEDTDAFGLGRPDSEPLASESIEGIIDLITELIERDLAYEAGGDVYFRVERMKDYGRLSNQQLEDLISGSRKDLEEGDKAAPHNFALWKATKKGEDTAWDSPWGRGRPGWHIECSAMAEKHLGDEFDIHGGGIDLIFPHHENEVAQSKGAGRKFARLWMHGGMLQISGGKMSKSEGNIATLHDLLKKWPAWVILLFYYGASYRNPIDFSDEALEETRKSGLRITEALRRSERFLATVITRGVDPGTSADTSRNWEGIHEALCDDFNTSAALGELFGLVYDLNAAVDERATPQIVSNLRGAIIEFLDLFVLSDLMPEPVDVSAEAHVLLDRREAARRSKDFEEADRIRDELLAMGYVVRDTTDGVDVVSVDGDEDSDDDSDDDSSGVEAGVGSAAK